MGSLGATEAGEQIGDGSLVPAVRHRLDPAGYASAFPRPAKRDCSGIGAAVSTASDERGLSHSRGVGEDGWGHKTCSNLNSTQNRISFRLTDQLLCPSSNSRFRPDQTPARKVAVLAGFCWVGSMRVAERQREKRLGDSRAPPGL